MVLAAVSRTPMLKWQVPMSGCIGDLLPARKGLLAVVLAATATTVVLSAVARAVVVEVAESGPQLGLVARVATPEGEAAVEVVVRMVALAVHLAPVELERATW